MASKVQGVARVARPTRYPWQLVVMVDGPINKRVRTLARERGESIASTLRVLIAEAIDARDRAQTSERSAA